MAEERGSKGSLEGEVMCLSDQDAQCSARQTEG